MKVICAWCDRPIGWRPGPGTTHGICKSCERKMKREIKQAQAGRKGK